MNFISVYKCHSHKHILYKLLQERTPEQSISHKEMPTWKEHSDFIDSHPYPIWEIVTDSEDKPIGSVYLTENREIGIFIFNTRQRQGYGRKIVMEMQNRFPGRILANVNPRNTASRDMFELLGAKLIQVTYELEGKK